ncbi:MAG TPA: DUF998 domain-containing protein [Gemmatimonadaceae bacterium]
MASVSVQPRPHVLKTPAVGSVIQTALLVAGLLSSAMYIAFDLISAARYPGYSLINQAISELSAIGAPTAGFWARLGPVYAVLFLAFVIGVLRAGRGNRALRRSGWIMLAFVGWGMLWPLFPMHQRGAETTSTDVGHLVLGAGSSLLILGFIVAGAFAFGRRFGAWSLAVAFVYLVTFIGTISYVPRMGVGASTPWLGVIERIMIYSYLLWVAVLAIALLRRGGTATSYRNDLLMGTS